MAEEFELTPLGLSACSEVMIRLVCREDVGMMFFKFKIHSILIYMTVLKINSCKLTKKCGELYKLLGYTCHLAVGQSCSATLLTLAWRWIYLSFLCFSCLILLDL